ncbi:MAG: hypothetical protein ABWK01_05245 [Infirmifilum sp.]
MGLVEDIIRRNIEKSVNALSTLDEKREELLVLTREITRKTREAIFAIHRGDLEKATLVLTEAQKLLGKVLEFKERYPSLYYTGSVSSAQAEYVEATALYAIVTSQEIPPLDELPVEPQAYLLGMGDLIGELRRSILDELRKDEIRRAWELMELMETVFFELSKPTLPEALVPGLRHKVDVARALLDSTKKDILFSEKSQRLTEKIQEALNKNDS